MLTGTIDTLTAGEVLQLLAATGKTGVLRLSGRDSGAIYCRDGVATFVTARDGDDLGSMLVRARFLGADDWTAIATADDAQRALAEVLTRDGVGADDLAAHVREQTEEALFELDLWESGRFVFEEGVDHFLGDAFPYDVTELLDEVERRRGSWPTITERLPSLDIVLQQVPPPPGDGGELTLSRRQWRVLSMADGTCTPKQISRHLGYGMFQTCTIIVSLLDAGLVDVHDAPPVVEVPGPPVVVDPVLGPAFDGRFDHSSGVPPTPTVAGDQADGPERIARAEVIGEVAALHLSADPLMASLARAAAEPRWEPPVQPETEAPVVALPRRAARTHDDHPDHDDEAVAMAHAASNGTDGAFTLAPGLPAVEFVSASDPSGRDLVLRLLSAVKELPS